MKLSQKILDHLDEQATTAAARGIVTNAWHVCRTASRVLAQRNAYRSFIKVLAKEFSRKTVDTPEIDLDCGPITNKCTSSGATVMLCCLSLTLGAVGKEAKGLQGALDDVFRIKIIMKYHG